ncbi:hypothetical protein [uncultured Gimesia sp.]|uniref:hypothetical protein n=1 Tax=uncultured Gimesia sp. TaxID=1678688 RepID=UPI0030D8A21F|tara:strand:+ start:41140 stop:41697 length:558 start_codon:yes stop_codon:yes gene_type:complete
MKAKYYTFNNDFDVGIAPQHQTMGSTYDYDAPDSVYQLPFDGLPDFEPDFNTIFLDDRAIVTDLISSAPIRNCGWLISGRFRAIIDSFSMPLHRYYAVPVVHRGQKIPDYWWLQLPHPNITIPPDASAAEAEEIIQSCNTLRDAAMFCLYRPPRFTYCFVQKDLRTAIEDAGITGVRFGTSRLFR